MWKLGVVLAVAAFPALAVTPSNSVQLAKALGDQRQTCESLASELAKNDRLEEFQRGLDSKLAMQQLQNDVSLYSIRHGRNQSNQYMLDLMDQKLKKDREDSSKAADLRVERSAKVADCISSGLEAGKATYGDFKKGKRPKKDADEAAVLMTSWVVNMESISLQTPEGSTESKAEWQKAKAHAELEAL